MCRHDKDVENTELRINIKQLNILVFPMHQFTEKVIIGICKWM